METDRISTLIIEDNPGDIRLLRHLLGTAEGVVFDLQTATRLATGLEMLREDDIEVVLLDLTLPDSRGLETFVRLHEEAPKTPVVVLTGLEDEDLASTAVRQGAEDYLVKGKVAGDLLIRSVRYAVERSRAKREREARDEAMRRSEKLELFRQLVGGIAHDFKNVLAAILTTSAAVSQELGPDHELAELFGVIRRSADRGTSMVRQLLAFSREEPAKPEVLSLNDVIGGLRKLLRGTVRDDVELSFKLEPALTTVKVDPNEIEQALLNMALNAEDAMHGGGELTVSTFNFEVDEAFAREHPELAEGSYAVLSVADDGCGMTDEVAARAFEPYFTTKERERGIGLGLATVYSAVQRAGGHVVLDTEIGVGTSFRIFLPVSREQATRIPRSATWDELPRVKSGGETILLVEDQSDTRSSLAKLLRQVGYSVIEARNGEQALRIATNFAGPIGLMLTDVVMPKMSGHELAERLASVRPALKVLYMSGYSFDVLGPHGITGEGVELLEKPFSGEVLLAKVGEILALRA